MTSARLLVKAGLAIWAGTLAVDAGVKNTEPTLLRLHFTQFFGFRHGVGSKIDSSSATSVRMSK